jgi:hypothetical protein
MSRITNRIFTEYGSTRAPSPFGEKGSKDSNDGTALQNNRSGVDRKPSAERDEIAWSVVLGYN